MPLAIAFQRLKRQNVALRQIADVDIVAYTGAVRRIIVIAKNLNFRQFSGGNLGDIGHQIVWNITRIFANHRAFIGAYRVEVTQHTTCPARVGFAHGFDHFFANEFRETVRVRMTA